jgi:AAA+ ATPase superfamily predicted ATPase
VSDFINRKNEIEELQELWGMKPQVALLWGRRRVGKTRLLDEFALDKPTIIFQADEGTATEQLLRLTERLLAYKEDAALRAQPLSNWDAATAVILRLAREAKNKNHPLLVIFDEFPRLVVSTPRLPSLFQDALENVRRENLPLFLILSGSQISLYEQHVLHGPLYGRRTWGEQLLPLNYLDASQFFPNWSVADKLRAWALLGGVPYYLEQWDKNKSLEWNITNRFLRKGAVLYDEAELMIKEELGSEAATYLSIIAAVAGGATRQSEIANQVGVTGKIVSKYLNLLNRLHMVERLEPLGSSGDGRRGIWQLSDNYLRSWFKFVRANRTELEARRNEIIFKTRVREELDQFVSKPAFEEAVREHARRSLGSDLDFPSHATVGAWWGPIPDDRYPGLRRTREGEIELVGYQGKQLVLAGEAKWSNNLEDGKALGQLRQTVVHVPGYDPNKTKLVIYSREGFTDNFQNRAKFEGIILRTVADLYV